VPARPDAWEDLILRGDVIPAESTADLLDVVPISVDFDASTELQRQREERL
jgi:hypothetical protein